MGGLALVGDHSTVPLTRVSYNMVFSDFQNARKAGTLCSGDLFLVTWEMYQAIQKLYGVRTNEIVVSWIHCGAQRCRQTCFFWTIFWLYKAPWLLMGSPSNTHYSFLGLYPSNRLVSTWFENAPPALHYCLSDVATWYYYVSKVWTAGCSNVRKIRKDNTYLRLNHHKILLTKGNYS